MARIAIGGFQHETNTFAPHKATMAAFLSAGEWPALARGVDLFPTIDGVHLPASGAVGVLQAAGHELVPLLWCAATPSAHVTEDAFERISAMLLADLAAAGPLDGIYLDLHGAMVCEHLEDGEGELLRRVRAQVGNTMPISVSLDLHANVTSEMVAHADVLDIFRTYPHIDMGETGARAARNLLKLMSASQRWYKAFRQIPFLIPLNWGCTLMGPSQALYNELPGFVSAEVPVFAFACGFPLADIADVGPSIVAYGRTQHAADKAADGFVASVMTREAEFSGPVFEPAAAVARAVQIAGNGAGPVVLADSQDNPGGGGPGDTTGLLSALIDGGAKGAVFGVLSDPEAAQAAHSAGLGAVIDLALGEKAGMAGHTPLHATVTVEALGDGRFTATGPMYKGARMDLGLMALVQTSGVYVLLGSKPVQTADQSIFRHVGIEPCQQPIIALKSSVHFRNDFEDMAAEVILVTAPGPVYMDPGSLTFNNARAGLRLRPAGTGP